MKATAKAASAILPIGLLAGSLLLTISGQAQVLPPTRGDYTPGFNATNSGVLPQPGFTYSNTFMDYSFNQARGGNGQLLPPDVSVTLFADANIFMWVSKKKILGANFALAAILPVTNSALSLAKLGPIGGGGGFSDSFFQPITFGWQFKRADIVAAYAFFAPTGRFNAGATNNTGSGHWTNALTGGETFYLTKNKGTAFSAYQMYEFHTTQWGTQIHPGQTFDLDYSLTQVLPLEKDMHTLLQVGVIGDEQIQTTNNGGPGVNSAIPAHYQVNALGAGGNLILPVRKVSLGFKWFKEFSNKATVQGYSVQISGAITF
jgi:hypothetical protein